MGSVKKTLCLPGDAGMPTVGLGTWTAFGEGGTAEELENAVKTAIDSGYRHIDCAWIYCIEDNVGNALEAKINDGTVKREDMFITTKLWDTHHNPTLVQKALKDSLRRLKTPYVDMYLIHWPMALKDGDFNYDNKLPTDENGQWVQARYKHEHVWKAMEDCQRAGLAKNIGLANFNCKQIANILESCAIKPANVQVEITPYFSNKKLVDFCQERGITVTAYSPLAAPNRSWRKENEPSPFDEPLLKEIAISKGKTIAQVVLRFHLQNGLVVIPKSVTPSRIKENIGVFDFELSDEDMKKISTLNKDLRMGLEDMNFSHPDYPFDDVLEKQKQKQPTG